MAKLKYQHHYKVLTANALRSGDVVFWSQAGWQKSIADAVLSENEQQSEALLTIGAGAEADNTVVDSYLVAIEQQAAGPVAVELRERARLQGPLIPSANEANIVREAA